MTGKIDLHQKYGLRRVINARGAFTPLGVSRTPAPVAEAAGEALRHFFDMAELQRAAGRVIAELTGCEWAAVTHCAAAGITLSAAAAMTGADMEKVARLPDTAGLSNRVVIPAGHLVDYGQPLEQAIRLAGAEVVAAGTRKKCTAEDLEACLAAGGVAALMLVESRLCVGDNPPAGEAAQFARERGIPVILDGAAQDLRMTELLATGADLVLFNAQKYLSAPTAGLVLGRRPLVEAVLLQEKGIGRAMKASKEAILGALAALEYRRDLDLAAWSAEKRREARAFTERLSTLPGVACELVPDPTHGPFSRVHARFDPTAAGKPAKQIARELAEGAPPIFVYEGFVDEGVLNFELLGLTESEREEIVARIASLLGQPLARHARPFVPGIQ